MKFKWQAGKMLMTQKGQIIKFKKDVFETSDSELIAELKKNAEIEEIKASKADK